MSIDDLKLLLEQSRLVAEANAISRGHQGAGPQEIAAEIGSTVNRWSLWRGDRDAQLIERYARGEVELAELAKHFASGS